MQRKALAPRTAPPQLSQPNTTQAMMRDILVALTPALAMSVFLFGPRVLVLCSLSVGSCVFFEYGYRRLFGLPNTTGDLSACVTGLLLGMSLPASAYYWVPVLGAGFAIVVIKQFYGGLGKNFMNPALGGRMLLATFPVLMSHWPDALDWVPLWGVDGVSSATPMSYLHQGTLPPLTMGQLFLGQQGGSIGEVSAFMLLMGGGYLVLRRVISLRIPLSFLGTVALLALLFPRGEGGAVAWMGAQLLSGGLLLGALFMATDPTSSPMTPRGQILFGVGCGLFTILLRYFGAYREGVGWAILTMNCSVWLLDRLGLPRRFGVSRFAVTRQLLQEIRRDLATIRFVMPPKPRSLRNPSGRVPGEAHLDQIRTQARALGMLGLVMLVMGGLVFGVHRYTELDTARASALAQQDLLAHVMPQAFTSSETPYRANGALSIRAGYSQDNELLGYCVEVQSHGFGGVIRLVVGVNLNGTVTGLVATDHRETAGMGTRALSQQALSRFVGMSGTIRQSGENSVDAISGATQTTKAVTAAVNQALAIVATLDTEGEVSYVDI